MPPDARTVLITGATDGLGRALAHRMAAEGDRLILHGRDSGRLDEVADSIAADGAQRPTTLRADLAELAQVRQLAGAVGEQTDRLDVLVSNAGIGSGAPDERTRQTSVDGHELRFAVNYLAGFLLTQELLGLMRDSAPARIVYVASLGQHPLDFDDLMLERDYSGTRAYAQSKLAQIMSGFTLAERIPFEEVTVNSLHPSTFMPTKIVLEEIGQSTDSLEAGVEATHHLSSGDDVAGTTGGFFDRMEPALANAQAYETDARATLWERSMELVG